jgi:hypothetical protein
VKSKTPAMVIAQRISAEPPMSTAPPRAAAAMITPVPPATTRSGIRAGRAAAGPTGPTGMSAVIAARSARLRAANAWPTRASNSSSVSRPATKAALSASITPSWSACDAPR